MSGCFAQVSLETEITLATADSKFSAESAGVGVCAEGLPRRGVVRVHHHIYPRAKCQRDRTICGRVIAI